MTDERFRLGRVELHRAAYAPHLHHPPHTDGVLRLSVVAAGGLVETSGGREETATAASVVVKPPDARHADRFGPRGARLVAVVAPEALVDGLDGAARALDGWRWFHGGPVSAAGVRLLRAVKAGDAEATEDAAFALLGALVETPDTRAGGAPGWLARVRERLDDEYDRPLSVAALAGGAGVHPVHLARLFRRHYGATVTGYRRRRRVRAAADALASTGAPAAAVALDAGFADQSHLCRAMRAELGVTPGALRALARG